MFTPCRYVAVTIAAVVVHMLYCLRKQDQRTFAVSCVRASGLLLWPVILGASVSWDRGAFSPCLYPALVWSSAAWLADVLSDGALFHIEPAALGGMFFGIAALVGSRPDLPHAHLFLYAVLCYLLLVVPQHSLGEGTMESDLMDASRRVALIWCVGFVLAATFLTRKCTKSESVTKPPRNLITKSA